MYTLPGLTLNSNQMFPKYYFKMEIVASGKITDLRYLEFVFDKKDLLFLLRKGSN